MAVLFLIRHGDNDTMHKRLAGRLAGVHLNRNGLRQADELADHLKIYPIKTVYSSPLERAIETAEPLARALGLTFQIRDDFNEVDYGSWQGQTYQQIRRTSLWEVVNKHPSQVQFPGGEKITTVQQRVIQGLNLIIQNNATAAIITHADIIKLALAYTLKMELDYYHRLVINPASVSVLELKDSMVLVSSINLTPQAVSCSIKNE